MRRFHCTVACTAALGSLIAGMGRPLLGAQSASPSSPTEIFTIFFRGAPIGTEQVVVGATSDARTIASSSRVGPPLDVLLRSFEAKYDRVWKPRELTIDSTVRGQSAKLHTTFDGPTALSRGEIQGQPLDKSDSVAPDTVILAVPSFGAYEALAARLIAMQPGGELRAYVVPQAEVAVRLTGVSQERIQTATRTINARRYQITFANPTGPLEAELWGEDTGRLLRFTVPVQSLDVIRQDIASVAARRQLVFRPEDEQVRVPASGFALAATVTKPPPPVGGSPTAVQRRTSPTRGPAVVLVGGSGPADRDETIAGIPIFGQIAGAIADAGFAVLRYDKRGVGQSGGRSDAATLSDYAEDLRAVLKYLRERKDINRERIALVGHGEGGAVALLAAAKERNLAALVLIATPATSGAELILEQQQRLLARLKTSETETQAKIEQQKQIQQAVITGTGWEGIPPALRRQADTPWFQSFLVFDPAKVIPDVRQPLLIIHGDLDAQISPTHAERLAALARARKRWAPVEVAMVAGVNHLLVPAMTGEVDEYASLKDKNVSPAALATLTAWLQKTLLPAVAQR